MSHTANALTKARNARGFLEKQGVNWPLKQNKIGHPIQKDEVSCSLYSLKVRQSPTYQASKLSVTDQILCLDC